MSKTPSFIRLDALLVKRGLAASKQQAQTMICEGQVKVNGLIATQPAMRVRKEHPIERVKDAPPWVGRGALKLLGALEPFQIQAVGRVCADLGASTGGFTQVLLEAGAQKVYAIDVGRGLLDWKLRTDERVIVMEETNVRHLESLPEKVDLIVGDLSFISLLLILPAVQRLLKIDGDAVLLIKPQFEVGKNAIQKGGTVRSAEERLAAIEKVLSFAREYGFQVINGRDSSVAGAKSGNVEYFTHLRWTGSS